MKSRGCFCIGTGKIKEKYLDSIKDIMKPIVKGYIYTIENKEAVIGYEDLPVYIIDGNTMLYDHRSIRFYYTE